MSSIPLPALGIRPPEQQEGPMDAYGKMMQLKTLLGQQQLQQQAMQSGQMDLQMKQIQMQDAQASSKAMHDLFAGGQESAAPQAGAQEGQQSAPQQAAAAPKVDITQLPRLIAKYGGSASAVMGAQKQVQEWQSKNSEMAKNDAETGSKNTETAIARNNQMAGIINATLGVKDEELPQAIISAATDGAQRGIFDAPHVQQAQQLAAAIQSGQLSPADARAKLKILSASLLTDSQQKEDALKAAQAGNAGAETQQKQIGLAATQLAGAKTRDDYARAYGQLPASVALKFPTPDKWTPQLSKSILEAGMTPEQVATTRQGASRTAVEWARLSEEKRKNQLLYGDLSTPSTPGQQGLIDMVGQGRAGADRLLMLLKQPGFLQEVAAKYPGFDASKIKAYTDAVKGFASGTESDQLTAGSVLLQHLQQLKAINDDNPTEVRIIGTDAYNKFHNLLDTIADEKATFYGEPKTNEAIGATKSTLGALTNRDAAITEQAKAMGVRLDELQEKWKKAAPSKEYEALYPDISAEAKQARASLDPEYGKRLQGQQQGGGAGPFAVTAPNGVTYHFKSQQDADNFKAKAGMK